MPRKKPLPPSTARAAQTAEKVAFVRTLFRKACSFGKVKQAFAIQFKCKPRTAEPFYKMAKEELAKELGFNSLDEMRHQSSEALQEIASNSKLPEHVRLAAIREFNNLWGLHAAIKVAPTNAAGQDLPPEGLRRRLTIAELDEELSKFAAGDMPGNDAGTGGDAPEGPDGPPPLSSSSLR